MLVKEIKVQYTNQKSHYGRNRRVPKIQLQGVQLEKAGFSHTDNIKVTMTDGKITIEKIN